MYVDRLRLKDVRTFTKADLRFVRPGRAADGSLPNVTLLLGDNAAGKSTVLQAIAAAAFGPAFPEAGLDLRGVVRVAPGGTQAESGSVRATFRLHEQDGHVGEAESALEFRPRGELVRTTFEGDPAPWDPVYESRNDAFFLCGYGATRRVELPDRFDMAARKEHRYPRAQRVQSLFEDGTTLVPLTSWLPKLEASEPGRFAQVVRLIDRLLSPSPFSFEGQFEAGEYVFRAGDARIPFTRMSDGYESFVGWVADFLYHLCFGRPPGAELVESRGVLLVDEIDLHLHPKWQREVVGALSKELPNVQFVLTTHSPLVAGSVAPENIRRLTRGRENRTSVRTSDVETAAMDADQILVSDLFGLRSTRRQADSRLERLSRAARRGEEGAAVDLIRALAAEPVP